MIASFATPEGTAHYRDRFPAMRDAGHFRRAQPVPEAKDIWLSSIGIGTYLGKTDAAADAAYKEAIAEAVRCGINVLDTAINYRNQRSERNIGAALQQLISAGEIRREEIFVCTKAGFLALDGDQPADPRGYFIDEYINKGILRPAEIAGGMHCMAPTYLENQLERSRKNLGLETLDVFYVHNPESQLSAGVSLTEFRQRLRDAFATLEKAVQAKKIRFYGCATWSGFRVPPAQPGAMSLEGMVAIAREVGGDGHHFRFVQLPFNLAMPEAFAEKNQRWRGENLSVFDLAARAGIAVVGSATLYQGKLTQNLPAGVGEKLGAHSDAESAIQFARSAPGIITALIGMGRREHVQANLQIAAQNLIPYPQWLGVFPHSG